MKAVRFHEHGGLDVLKYEDAPEPEIQPNEVLVKVKACALNHLDLWLREWRARLEAAHAAHCGQRHLRRSCEVGALVER